MTDTPTEAHPHLHELFALLPTMNQESARGVTLVVCSHADLLLERIIRAFLLEGSEADKLLSGFNAPLSSFASRVTAARSLSLITSGEYEELDCLRRIRNEFAHTVHCTFSDHKVMSLCGRLKMAAKELSGEKMDASIARAAFTTSGVSLIAHLTNREAYVARHRLQNRNWPY